MFVEVNGEDDITPADRNFLLLFQRSFHPVRAHALTTEFSNTTGPGSCFLKVAVTSASPGRIIKID